MGKVPGVAASADALMNRSSGLDGVGTELMRIRQPPCHAAVCFAAASLLWIAPAAGAAESLHDAIAAAWARMPQQALFAARENTAAARYQAGGAAFPDAPFADGEYDDDRLGSNDEYRTTRIELGTPLWLPGEGTATQGAAAAEKTAVAGARDSAHLAVASRVLELAVQAQLALDSRTVAQRRLAADTALARYAAERFHVGEGSRSNSLAAEAEADSDAVSLSDAEARLGSAVVALAAITGSESVPALTMDRQVALAGRRGAMIKAIEQNPRIVAAQQAVAAAEAKARLVRLQNRADPDIGLQLTNDKQPGSPWDTRAGMVLHVPFPSYARNAPRRAEAAEEVTRAEVQLALARRAVGAALRDAAIAEAAAERSNAAASRAADALALRRGEIRRAWLVGEMPLIELVRAQAAAFDAELARARTRTEAEAGRIQLMLAMGQIP